MPLGEAGDSQWEFVPGVCASLAASSLSLRLWILPHNPPALLMPESVDKKLLSCSLPPVLKCKFEPLGRQETFELQAKATKAQPAVATQLRKIALVHSSRSLRTSLD